MHVKLNTRSGPSRVCALPSALCPACKRPFLYICKLGLGPSDRLYASMWTGQVVHAGCVCIYITEVPFCLCGFVSVTVRNEKTNSGLVRLKIKPFFIGKEQYGRLGVHGVSGKRNPVISQ